MAVHTRKRRIHVLALELCVAYCESFSCWRVLVIIVAGSTRGCEVLDTIVVITLVAFSNEADVGSCGYSVNDFFLLLVSIYGLGGGRKKEVPQAFLQLY